MDSANLLKIPICRTHTHACAHRKTYVRTYFIHLYILKLVNTKIVKQNIILGLNINRPDNKFPLGKLYKCINKSNRIVNPTIHQLDYHFPCCYVRLLATQLLISDLLEIYL